MLTHDQRAALKQNRQVRFSAQIFHIILTLTCCVQKGPKALTVIHSELAGGTVSDSEKAFELAMANCVWSHFPAYLNRHEERAADRAMREVSLSEEDNDPVARVSCMSRRVLYIAQVLLRASKRGANIMRTQHLIILKHLTWSIIGNN